MLDKFCYEFFQCTFFDFFFQTNANKRKFNVKINWILFVCNIKQKKPARKTPYSALIRQTPSKNSSPCPKQWKSRQWRLHRPLRRCLCLTWRASRGIWWIHRRAWLTVIQVWRTIWMAPCWAAAVSALPRLYLHAPKTAPRATRSPSIWLNTVATTRPFPCLARALVCPQLSWMIRRIRPPCCLLRITIWRLMPRIRRRLVMRLSRRMARRVLWWMVWVTMWSWLAMRKRTRVAPVWPPMWTRTSVRPRFRSELLFWTDVRTS